MSSKLKDENGARGKPSSELSTSQEGETTLIDNALKIQRKIIHKLEF